MSRLRRGRSRAGPSFTWAGRRSRSASRSGWATRWPWPRSRRASPPQVRPDHRLRIEADRGRVARPRPEPPRRPLRARLRLRVRAARAPASRTAPGRSWGTSRPDGRVGTRNYVAVISTVNCSASTSRYIADRFRDGAWRQDFPNVDGVFAITHKGGCGLPFEGPDHQILERVLAGFANHPNVAAYVIVGLGCEVGFAQHLVDSQHLVTLGAGHGTGTRSARTGPGYSTSRNRAESPGPSRRP